MPKITPEIFSYIKKWSQMLLFTKKKKKYKISYKDILYNIRHVLIYFIFGCTVSSLVCSGSL